MATPFVRRAYRLHPNWPSTACGQSWRSAMRQEFSFYAIPPVIGFTFCGFFAMVFVMAGLGAAGKKDTLLALTLIASGIFIILWAFILLWWWRKTASRLLIAVDDSGHWLKEIGQLMLWSEIQSISLRGDADVDPEPLFDIVWNGKPYRVNGDVLYRDRNGTAWWVRSVYKQIEIHRARAVDRGDPRAMSFDG
jgi:Zn-dependent protease with chaperone function